MLVPLLDVSRLSDPAPYRRRPPAPTPRVTRAGRRSPPVQRQMDESFQRSPLSAPDATRGEVLEHRHTPRRICWFRCSKFPEFPILLDTAVVRQLRPLVSRGLGGATPSSNGRWMGRTPSLSTYRDQRGDFGAPPHIEGNMLVPLPDVAIARCIRYSAYPLPDLSVARCDRYPI